MKKIYESKTVQKAVAVGVIGIAIAIFTELEYLGAVMVLNAVADIYLRKVTTTSIE